MRLPKGEGGEQNGKGAQLTVAEDYGFSGGKCGVVKTQRGDSYTSKHSAVSQTYLKKEKQ